MMSKAARKRRNSRRRWLQSVAQGHPEFFATVWARRLESWVQGAQIHQKANELVDDCGRPTRTVFRIVDYALAELAAIGNDVYHAHAESTRGYLMERCCRAVADTVDRRLYPQAYWPDNETMGRMTTVKRSAGTRSSVTRSMGWRGNSQWKH